MATGMGKWGMTNGSAAGLILADIITGQEKPWAAALKPRLAGSIPGLGKFARLNAEVGVKLLKGWAVESRIYAEDPTRNFLPSTGRLVKYRPPEEGHEDGVTIRNDTGVFEGDVGVELDVPRFDRFSQPVEHAHQQHCEVDGLPRQFLFEVLHLLLLNPFIIRLA